ncbi:hypothetical protein CL684_02085 [Candidatus Campbellbacteria bacterium]|nr:hypothetical protein [Candidatus Campbellbacteria bacterium]|tara:strand:- start:12 stop:545 length:534 start_codon:yes stop_codon:yes gene_type:complete
MKKTFFIIISIALLALVWYLISPLVTNTTVNEELPVENLANRAVPGDIIVGNDISISEDMEDMQISQGEMSVVEAGTFSGADDFHQAAGKLKIIRDEEKTYLRFEDFEVTNGPDLFVTLNKKSNPSSADFGEHVTVSRLKGNIGAQNYDVSAYNLDEYESVSIYCRAFSTLFATAQL